MSDSSSGHVHGDMYMGKVKPTHVYVALYVIFNIIAHIQVHKQLFYKI
jgi:hypothetical protein